MTNPTEPLDVLAKKASFASVNDMLAGIQGTRLTFGHFLICQGSVFCRWDELSHTQTGGNLEVVAFTDANNYSTARMYKIPEGLLSKAVISYTPIYLSNETPMHVGDKVAEVLVDYAKQYMETNKQS